MSSSILGGDVTVYYLDEGRRKQLEWTGSASGTRTANELYSALQDLFDDVGQMDDGVPMSAQTPVEYTVGIIDANDVEPWYISYRLMQHITGGAIRTAGWTHVQSSAVGIVVVPVSSGGTIVQGDIGFAISGATTGDGVLLEFIDTGGATDYLVIRPDTSAAAQEFTTASQTITCNGHTASQSGALQFTGEQIWANFFSLGTIENDTHIYFYQGAAASDAARVRVLSITDQTQDWWSDGHVDVCIPIRDFKQNTNPIIDGGFVTALARQYTKEYSSFESSSSTTSGGRNPVPLGTKADLNNTTGYKSITFTSASGNWNVGDEIEGATSGARGIITQIDSPGSTQTVHYYLIDDPLTDFQTAAETVNNNDDTGTGSKNGNAPANQGPALTAWFTGSGVPTTAFGFASADIDDNGSNERYGITIDCNQNPLSQVYEWLKYITRRGATVTTNTDGIPGELYIGAEVYLAYSGTVSGGTVGEGDDVTQATTGATGVVISHDTTNKVLLLRSTRGSFTTSQVVTSTDNSGSFTPDLAAVAFAPNVVSPFGTFAGGTFFGARGVLLSDWNSADENSFQLTPIPGGTVERPQAITLTVSNLVGAAESNTTSDIVEVFRLTAVSGVIDKTEFSALGGEAIGANSITVDTAIPQDVPGKTTGGALHIRDASANNAGYRLRYNSWAANTFSLSNIVIAAADAGTNTTAVFEAGAFATAKRGDLVLNLTRSNAVSYVTAVVNNDVVTIDPPITGQTTADNIELNAVPITMNTADDVYVALLSKYADATSASVSIVYSTRIDYRVYARNSRHVNSILPFTTDDFTEGTDKSTAVIRNPDTIKT